MSRRNTRERIEARRAQQRKRQQTQMIIGVVVLAVIAAVALILLNRPGSAAAVVETDYEGLEQTVDETETGVAFVLGDPDAPVTITDFSDFSCPHCHDLSGPMGQIIDEYVRDGKVKLAFKPASILGEYSEISARGAICAGYQGKFWEMHDQLWATYDSVGSPAGYTPARMRTMAQNIGLDMDEYNACYNDPETEQARIGVLNEMRQRGITGTPGILVNGQNVPYRGVDVVYDDLSFVIDGELGQ